MNVLTCDQCQSAETVNNQMDWVKMSDSFGWSGDLCSWNCVRDFGQAMVDNPPEQVQDVPALQPGPPNG